MKRIISFILALVLCFSLAACGEEEVREGEAKTQASASSYKYDNYLEVIEDFEKAGFTNIKTEAIYDIYFGWFMDDGEVEEISIGGNTEFSSNEWFPEDIEVVVRYHTLHENEDNADDIVISSSSHSSEISEYSESESTSENSDITSSGSYSSSSEVVEEKEILNDDSTFSIHFIDVGQADAALVECDGHYMLIDGGNKADSSLIYSVLKNKGVLKLDIVVGTHAHEDHIGGIPGAFNYASAEKTFSPVYSYDSEAFKDFVTYANKSGGGIIIPEVGDVYSLGSAEVEILGVNGDSDTNNTSIVLMITYGETSFLFTGDAEREAEQVILNSGVNLSATVLKVGHHGSDTSTTYPFLREIMPEFAIISVGKDNSYGHPTDNTLSRLRDADVKVFRTDLQGDIYLTSDGKTVTITTEKKASQEEIMTAGGYYTSSSSSSSSSSYVSSEDSGDGNSQEYVLNTNTKKFHYPYCSSVKRMSEKNKKVVTATREEIIAQGYDPCGNCNP